MAKPEVFQTLETKDAPLRYRKYNRLEFVRDGDREWLRGIAIVEGEEKKRPLRIGKLITEYGFNAEPQESARALWKNDDNDTPVTIEGYIGRVDDEDYLKATGSDTGIPRSQLEWVSDGDRSENSNSELDDLRQELSELRQKVERMDAVQAENQQLKQKNEELKREIEQLRQASSNRTETTSDLADEPDAIVQPEIEPEFHRILTPDTSTASRWNRFRARAGNLLTGRTLFANAQTRWGERDGRRYRIVEEEVQDDGTIESDRRAGTAAVIGGAALVGAGVLAGYLIWGRHTGHNPLVINHNHTKTVTDTVTLPSSGGSVRNIEVNHNTELWNAQTGGGGDVGISLPRGYHLVKSSTSGYHEIVTSNGRVVADHIEMSQTGAISQGTLDELKKRGLVKIGQTHLSYWDNTGYTKNPKLPSAKNPGWNRHTVTVLGKS